MRGVRRGAPQEPGRLRLAAAAALGLAPSLNVSEFPPSRAIRCVLCHWCVIQCFKYSCVLCVKP